MGKVCRVIPKQQTDRVWQWVGVSHDIVGRSVVLEGPGPCSWKRPLRCPGLGYHKAERVVGRAPLCDRHWPQRGQIVICLGRIRGRGGLVASTSSHSPPCVSPPLLCLPLSIHLPTLSHLFTHSLPAPLGPCSSLCLPCCPSVVSLTLTLLLGLALLSLTVLSSSFLSST